MKIEPQKAELKQLEQRYKNVVTNREREIKVLDNFYDKKVANTKAQGEQRTHEALDNNQKDLLAAVDGKQERLEQMREDLRLTDERLGNESEKLRRQHQTQIDDINRLSAFKHAERFQQAHEEAQKVAFDIDQKVGDIETDSVREIAESQYRGKSRLDNVNADFQAKLNRTERDLGDQLRKSQRDHQTSLAEKREIHKKEIQQNDKKGLMETKERELINKSQASMQQNFHQDRLKQNEASFQTRYAAVEEGQKAILSAMEKRFESELDRLSKSQQTKMELINERKDDDFYKVQRLEPKIQDAGDAYIVTIDVPEHEKENVRVSANGRSLTVSFARRYTDRVEAEDGTVSHTKKSESISRELNVPDLVNRNKVTRRFEDGALSFRVEKA
jgi:HSP20 family molecular chaperone IbpA